MLLVSEVEYSVPSLNYHGPVDELIYASFVCVLWSLPWLFQHRRKISIYVTPISVILHWDILVGMMADKIGYRS